MSTKTRLRRGAKPSINTRRAGGPAGPVAALAMENES
jgi:hypothetical protein